LPCLKKNNFTNSSSNESLNIEDYSSNSFRSSGPCYFFTRKFKVLPIVFFFSAIFCTPKKFSFLGVTTFCFSYCLAISLSARFVWLKILTFSDFVCENQSEYSSTKHFFDLNKSKRNVSKYFFCNDPPAGSPTGTLLRLSPSSKTGNSIKVGQVFAHSKQKTILPKKEKNPSAFSRSQYQSQSVEATGGVYKRQGRIQHALMTYIYKVFLVQEK